MKKFYTDLDHTETNTQMPPTMAVAVVVAVHHRLTRVSTQFADFTLFAVCFSNKQ